MKFSAKMIVAALIVAPVVSFAQSSQPVTRAQVNAELAKLEKAGYDPHDWVHYPENIQAAQAKIAAQKNRDQGYGGAVDGTSGTANGL